jgi:hypothetical protein
MGEKIRRPVLEGVGERPLSVKPSPMLLLIKSHQGSKPFTPKPTPAVPITAKAPAFAGEKPLTPKPLLTGTEVVPENWTGG